jgi:phage baseplate assembly protein W
MATSVISPSREYSDLDLNFIIHPVRKDINKNVGVQSVINSVKNLLLTGHYERPFHPEIGSNVRKMLFEPMDAIVAVNLQKEIEETLNNYEPRIRIRQIIVTPNFDSNGFEVYLEFNILNRTEPITINFLLSRVR